MLLPKFNKTSTPFFSSHPKNTPLLSANHPSTPHLFKHQKQSLPNRYTITTNQFHTNKSMDSRNSLLPFSKHPKTLKPIPQPTSPNNLSSDECLMRTYGDTSHWNRKKKENLYSDLQVIKQFRVHYRNKLIAKFEN
jgi:hypothetical protein